MKSKVFVALLLGVLGTATAWAAPAVQPSPTPTRPAQQKSQTLQQRRQQQQRTAMQRPPRKRRYYRIYVGGLLGMGFPAGNFSQIGSKLAYGFDADFKVSRQFGFGAYFLHGSGSYSTSGVSSSFSLSFYGLEMNYYVPNGFNFGARVGLTSISMTVAEPLGTLTGSTSPISFGPRVGYDRRIGHTPLTLGAELAAMFVESATTAQDPTTGQSLSTPFFPIYTAMVTAKYWF